MAGRRPTDLAVAARIRNREQLTSVGTDVRKARLRRHLSQAKLGERAGVSRMSISRAERGLGGGLTLDAWQRIATALDVTLKVQLQRDYLQEPQDAGHLGIQELILRLGRRHGYPREVELPTKPAEAWRSIDVSLVNDLRRRLIVVECWNVIGDVGASARSSARKAAEAGAIADLRWGDQPHSTHLVWVVRATKRNRELLARYPEVFAARFPGSSAAWARALNDGADPPGEPGLVWASVDGTRSTRGVDGRIPALERRSRQSPYGQARYRAEECAPAPLGDRPRREDEHMDHRDHVALIRAGVDGAGTRWLELGAGDGAFTLALADVLGPGGEVTAVDRDRRALAANAENVARRFPATRLSTLAADFTRGLPRGPFDGVLAANSLHFVKDRTELLAAIRALTGRLVVVEYDADRGNPWVPHPFSFETWRREARAAGFAEPTLIHRVPSRFLGAIYGAVTLPDDSSAPGRRT